MGEDQSPEISVIIPTFNRVTILRRTLNALSTQRNVARKYEVIVVDDGSVDETETMVQNYRALQTLPLRYLRQDNQGPGAARNRGILQARGRLVVFIGDDTIPQQEFLSEHLLCQNRCGPGIAVVGYTSWAPEIKVNTLTDYIDKSPLPQFEYDAISDPDDLPYRFFYTSNVSLERSFLISAGLFDEDLPYAYAEDGELGYRLRKAGLRIVFNPHAIAHHYHPMTLDGLLKRARTAGLASSLVAAKHPELFPARPSSLRLVRSIAVRFAGIAVGASLPFIRYVDREGLRFDRYPVKLLLDLAVKYQFWQGLAGKNL